MEENKNLENLEAEEVVEEAAEAEVTEEAEVSAEAAQEAVGTLESAQIKKSSKIGAVVAVVVAIIVVAAAMITSTMEFNKYNKMGFINVSGMTIQDMLDQQGTTYEEFIAEYGLPNDMAADTIIEVAEYYIPVKKVAENNGMDFATIKEMLQFPEGVTEDTPWGEVVDMKPIKEAVGLTEEDLPSFKETYGLDDSVTLDTLYKDIRHKIAQVELEKRLEQEKLAEEDSKAEAEETDDNADAPAAE